MRLTFKSTVPLMQLHYDVFDDGKIFSKLEFMFHYKYSKPATATIGDRQLDLDGWVLPITKDQIKDSKTQEVIGTYYSRFLSKRGTLKLNNQEYSLRQNSSERLKYSWILERGKEKIIYNLEGFMLNSGEIYISPELEKDPNLKLLVIIGLYEILSNERLHTKASKGAIITMCIVFAVFISTLIYIFYLMQACQTC